MGTLIDRRKHCDTVEYNQTRKEQRMLHSTKTRVSRQVRSRLETYSKRIKNGEISKTYMLKKALLLIFFLGFLKFCYLFRQRYLFVSQNLDTIKKYKKAPQLLQSRGRYIHQSARPFISQDIWDEVANHKTIFFVRPMEPFYPETEKKWKKWLDKRIPDGPVTVIMNNQWDRGWPRGDNSFTEDLLSHPNLKRLYVCNPTIIHQKVSPLPVGLRYQLYSTKLYAESKKEKNDLFRSVSGSPMESKNLMMSKDQNRTLTVWVRPMGYTDELRSVNFEKNTSALTTKRRYLCSKLKISAPGSAVCEHDVEFYNDTTYFNELKTHTFVASPPGNGLDTHTTWEALLAGCIPIVPHSSLDPMFKDLPVWLINDWDEVTDETVKDRANYFKKNIWNWDKIFVDGWIKEMIGIDWYEEYNKVPV